MRPGRFGVIKICDVSTKFIRACPNGTGGHWRQNNLCVRPETSDIRHSERRVKFPLNTYYCFLPRGTPVKFLIILCLF